MKLVILAALLALCSLSAQAQTACTGHYPTLNWTAPTTGGTPVGYNAYRGTVAGGPYTKANAALVSGTTYDDCAANGPGVKYYFVVRTVDSAGIESANSNEASAVIPQAPQAPALSQPVVH